MRFPKLQQQEANQRSMNLKKKPSWAAASLLYISLPLFHFIVAVVASCRRHFPNKSRRALSLFFKNSNMCVLRRGKLLAPIKAAQDLSITNFSLPHNAGNRGSKTFSRSSSSQWRFVGKVLLSAHFASSFPTYRPRPHTHKVISTKILPKNSSINGKFFLEKCCKS